MISQSKTFFPGCLFAIALMTLLSVRGTCGGRKLILPSGPISVTRGSSETS